MFKYDKKFFRNEKGVVLVVALLILMVLTLLITTAVMTTTTDLKITGNYKTGETAFYAAEAGIEEARARLRLNAVSVISDTDPTSSVWERYIGTAANCAELGFNSGNSHHNRVDSLQSDLNYAVKIIHKTDGSGNVVYFAPGNNIYVITSTGTAAGAKKTTKVEVTRYPPIDAPGALYVSNSLQVSGSSQITATATSTGQSGCGPAMAGVATPLAKTSVDFGGNPDRIIGAGGEGLDGIRDFVNPPLDIPGMAAGLKNSANFSYSVTGDPSITGMNWGTPSSGAPPSTCSVSNIVYYNTNGDGINLHNASGCGTLIVDGPLRIDGNFSWHGVIISTGSLTYIGTGNKNVTGAMLSGGGVITDLIGGNADIYYCSGAIRDATQNMPLKKLNWRDMAF